MAKINYSPEAIQARQQAALNDWNARFVQQPTGQPTQTTQTTQTTDQAFNLGGELPQQPPQFNVPTARPYMAQDMAQVQTLLGDEAEEPIYYSGRVRDGLAGTWDAMIANPFKNWARRTWAAINNPNDILPAPTAEQSQKIERMTEASVKAAKANPIIARIGETVEGFTGIDMEEVFKSVATANIKSEEGLGEIISVATGIATRSVKQAAISGLMAVFGAPEWGVKNAIAVAKGIDETLDEVAKPDREVAQGSRNIAARMIEAVEEKNIPHYIPPELGITDETADKLQKIVDFRKVLSALNPVELVKDGVRFVANIDKIKVNQLFYNINEDVAGLNALYSLIQDDAKNAEYERRYASGENPLKLAYELQNPLTELVGGILLDPTTWIGGGAAKELIDPKTGLRILKGGIKSASGNAIANALPDIRMAKPIKDAAEAIVKAADGGTPKAVDELLGLVHNAFKATRDEFTKWANNRSLTSYVSSDKHRIVMEEMRDMLHNMVGRVKNKDDAVDLMTGAIHHLREFAKGGGDNQSFFALYNSPFGQYLLSPRGMRMGNLLAGLDEINPLIEAAIKTGDVRKLANVYALQLDNVVGKNIMSVTDMMEKATEIKSKIKLTSDAGELAKLNAELKTLALPPSAKFINGVNELAKKPYLKSMQFFSQIYFGLNRFAYPTRNVLAAIPGVAYEFGFLESARTAGRAILGSQVEKIGQDYLVKMQDEIQSLIGYVPEVFKFGATPIGEFVKTDKKILGLVRGGGEVARLSEQIMGAQIMLKTIKREIANALKHVAIPATSIPSSNILYKYANEYGGDAVRAVAEFRKTIANGGEEVWRHLPLPEKLAGVFDSIHPDMVKRFNTIRETAKTADEFRTLMADLWKSVDDVAEEARTVTPVLSEELADFSSDINRELEIVGGVMRSGIYPTPENIDNFARVVQGFQNAKKAMNEIIEPMKSWLYRAGAGDYSADFVKLFGDSNAPQNAARDVMWKVHDNWANMTSTEIYDALNKMDDGMFKISKMTEIDPSKVTNREMIRVAWDAYRQWSRNYWAGVSTDFNKGAIDVLSRMAKSIGTTIEQAAKQSGVNYQRAIDEYNTAIKLFEESQIDSLVALRRKVPDGTNLSKVNIESIKKMGYKSLDHVRNAINKYRKALGEEAYQTVNDVPFWEVEDLYRRVKRADGFIPDIENVKTADLLDDAIYKKMSMPPIAADQPVTIARMLAASPDAKKTFDAFINATAKQWGIIEPVEGALDDAAEIALGEWAQTLKRNMSAVKTEAGEIAKATRNAMLYDYRKKLWNVAVQYISPFHYYHASASNQWLQNAAADPKWAAIYLDYKEYMERRHAGLPDFWKQNVAVSGLFGYDRDNPLFFNIEASLNPLYQMIGQDYNDPRRRADWFSTVIDDVSKVVPGIYQPLQWLVAANLYRKGEVEAGERWRGRLIPQTKLIKSVTNKLGIDIPMTKYNELDPFVGLMGDGIDSYEEGRINRYLFNMPGVSEEAKIQASHAREGDLWEQAVRGALGNRAVAEMASYFLGVGYKPRTTGDIRTDKFYTDYRKLIAARSIMQPDAYRDAWDALRIQYPDMDVLLIGKKAGAERDTAFAYNVLGRVPPSEMADISKFIGIEPYMLESFYDNKGDMSKMLPQDRDRFMAAMLDLSAMLKMPDGATKQEWSKAKSMYAELNKALVEDYGENIIAKMDEFYTVPEADRTDWLEQNPDVKAAMEDKTAYITNTPILAAYYGGIDVVARYYNNKMYETLEQEFGADIQKKVDTYYDLGDQGLTKEQKLYKKQNGLTAYFARLSVLQQEANLKAIETSKFIPEGKDYQIRPEFEPQSGIQQGAFQYATTDQQTIIAQEIIAQLSDPMKALLQQYYAGGELTYAVGKRLEYIGRDYGLSKQEVLRLLGLP